MELGVGWAVVEKRAERELEEACEVVGLLLRRMGRMALA